MVFRFSFSDDAASPNVLSPEIFNLLIFLICIAFFIWMIRMCKGFISMAQLVYALRSGRFNILNIANFDRIDNLWGEGSVRSFIQALFRGNVASPSVTMKRINTTMNLNKNSLKVDCRNVNAQQEKGYGVTFKFDSLVPATIQLFWGVREQVFNEKVLQPFQQMFVSNLCLNEKGEVMIVSNHGNDDYDGGSHNDDDDHVIVMNEEDENGGDDMPMDEELDEEEEEEDEEDDDGRIHLLGSNGNNARTTINRKTNRKNNSSNNNSKRTTSNRSTRHTKKTTSQQRTTQTKLMIDLNTILEREDYLDKSEPKAFVPSLDNMFVLPLTQLIPESQIDQYFSSLPLHRRSATSGASSSNVAAATSAESAENSQEHSVEQQDNEENAPDSTVINVNEEGDSAAVIVDDENDEINRVTLPLIIVIRATARYASSESMKRTTENGPYDEESVCIYCIAHFTKNNNTSESNSSSPSYSIKVYKSLVQTEQGLYEMQDIYGTSDEGASDQDEKCIICWDNDREVTLLPCRHMCVCQECFQQIDKCPICRQNTTSYIIMGRPEYSQTSVELDQPRAERLVD